jgi:hypothetical protein
VTNAVATTDRTRNMATIQTAFCAEVDPASSVRRQPHPQRSKIKIIHPSKEKRKEENERK